MPRLHIIQLACVLTFCLATGQTADPCSTHTVIDNPKRSVVYELQNNDFPIHDYYTIVEGNWYRFKFYGTDVEIPEIPPGEIVPSRHCGTQSPIWINGNNSHPIGGSEVNGTVCTSYGMSPCEWNAAINITKCGLGVGEYYVYQLARPEAVSIAYCAGEEMPCTTGQGYNATLKECVDLPTTTTSSTTTRTTTEATSSHTTRTTTKATIPSEMRSWLIPTTILVCCWVGCTAALLAYLFFSWKKKKQSVSHSSEAHNANQTRVVPPLAPPPYSQDKGPAWLFDSTPGPTVHGASPDNTKP